VPDDVVNRQAVGHVSAGTVDIETDRTVVVVGQLPQPLYTQPGRVFLDVSNQIHIALTLALLLAKLRPDGFDQFGDQTIAQLTHGSLSHRRKLNGFGG
jgi:hypothetical protein